MTLYPDQFLLASTLRNLKYKIYTTLLSFEKKDAKQENEDNPQVLANDVNYIYLLEESLDVPPAFETQQDTLKTINFKNENEGEDVEIREE